MKNKVAFCIPTYPPHFKYVKCFYNSYLHYNFDQQSDIWLIFTNKQEKQLFGKTDNYIIFEDSGFDLNYKGIINKKKLYGIYRLKDMYDYIIVLDSESSLIKEVDLLEICESYFKRKVLYGNQTYQYFKDIHNNIINHSKKYFPEDLFNKKVSTELYLWFNQPCIYKSSTIDHFFKVINYKNIINNLDFFDFDYYIYMFYLIIYNDFRIDDLETEAINSLCENTNHNFVFLSKKYKNSNILLSSPYMLKYLDNKNLFLLINIDRQDILNDIIIDTINALNNNNEKNKLKKIFNFLFSIESLQDKKIITLFGFKITIKTRPDQTRPDQTRPDQTRNYNICSDYIYFYNNTIHKKIQPMLQYKNAA